MEFAIFCFVASTVFVSLSRAQAPIFEITPADSWIKFHVKASTMIAGKFDNCDAKLTFTSPDEATGVLEINIQTASVDTGSGMKNGKLKGKDFFDVQQNPLITFKSTKFVQTGPNTFEVDGHFTIRGVSNPEKLTLTASGKGTGSGESVLRCARWRSECPRCDEFWRQRRSRRSHRDEWFCRRIGCSQKQVGGLPFERAVKRQEAADGSNGFLGISRDVNLLTNLQIVETESNAVVVRESVT
jgi:polyisoprenoid-binding protein YceI